MDELEKLVNIVKRHGQRSLQIIEREYKSKQPTKDTQLYQAIMSGDYKSEDEIAREVFQTHKDDRNFKITKSRLKEKLLNNLFLLDYHKSDFTEYLRAEYDCMHIFHQGKVLMLEGDIENSVRILKNLVKKAIEFELFEIAIDSLLLIRKQYSEWGKLSLFEKYNRQLSRIKQKSQLHDTYKEKFERMSAAANKSYNAAIHVRKEIKKLVPELKQKSTDSGIRDLDVMAEKLNIKLGWIDQDYEKILDSCNYLEATYFPSDTNQIKVDILPEFIYQNSIRAFYIMKQFQNGLNYIDRRPYIGRKGTCYWYWLEEYKLLLHFGLGQFNKATETLMELKSCRVPVNNGDDLLERIKLYRLYLLYFLPNEKQLYWGFHWEELLRENPEYCDKYKAYHVAFLILQFLYYLRSVEIEELKNTLEKLKPFSTEHLSRKSNYRISIFVRMLEIVIEKNFDYLSIIERCSNYSGKLKDSNLGTIIDHEFEVVPYDQLWQEIITILQEQKDYKHYRFYHLYEMEEH